MILQDKVVHHESWLHECSYLHMSVLCFLLCVTVRTGSEHLHQLNGQRWGRKCPRHSPYINLRRTNWIFHPNYKQDLRVWAMHMSIITLCQLKQRKYFTIFCALAALQPMRGSKNLFELEPEFIVLKFKTFIYIFSNYALKYFLQFRPQMLR